MKQMNHPKIIQQVGNSIIRVQQLKIKLVPVVADFLALLIPQSESGEHTQERAVHGHTLTKV